MSSNLKNKKLMGKMLSKEVLESNDFALRIYDIYRKTFDIIERTNYALGRKPAFKLNIGSTLNCKVNINANSSTTTTTQKI
jgi:hypothetical protein